MRLPAGSLALLCIAMSCVSRGQQTDPLSLEGYLTPERAVRDIVAAPRHTNVGFSNLSPDGKWFCETVQPQYVSLAELSHPYINLGGVQIDPIASRSRMQSIRSAKQLVFYAAGEAAPHSVSLPSGARVSRPVWSPSGRLVAFLVFEPTLTTLWKADPVQLKAVQISKTPLLTTLEDAIEWSADESSIYVVAMPAARPVRGYRNAVPNQPRVLVSEPSVNKSRPLRNLMETQADQQDFEHFTTGQVCKIDVATGKAALIGSPAMISSLSVSPDGTALRVTQITKPFSYVVTTTAFGTRDELWNAEGKLIELVQRRNLRLGDPIPATTPTAPGPRGPRGGGGVAPGQGAGSQRTAPKRSISWRPDGNGISFLQLEPLPPRKEGEPEPPQQGERKDRVMQWVAPYGEKDVKTVYTHERGIGSVSYTADGKWLIITQTKDGKSETLAFNPSSMSKPVVLSSSAATDFYNQPGRLLSKLNDKGESVVRITSDGCVIFQGTEYSKEPEKMHPLAFLDKVELATGKKTRHWTASDQVFETIDQVLDNDATKLLVERESPTQFPQTFLVQIGGGSATQLTQNKDFAPEVSAAQRFRIPITRADGFKFWANVTMPKWWMPGVKLPAMFWFYPNEVVDQKTYDESKRTYNKCSFPGTGARSMSILTLLGYAVVEPDCPIVGPAERKNDAYVPQLRNSLSAVIDELEKRGFIDRSRLGIGGHSYGAFSSANAMVHTPFFKAGIAGDGNYNRLLTPMAFQAETRTLWEAREVYLSMSPLLYAEQMTGAFLMYHGADDNNAGTHPINSERMFNALDGLGKDTALYVYPYEDHNAICMETVLDMWARWIPWLDKYVKNPQKSKAPAVPARTEPDPDEPPSSS